jgi:hypothetical protein
MTKGLPKTSQASWPNPNHTETWQPGKLLYRYISSSWGMNPPIDCDGDWSALSEAAQVGWATIAERFIAEHRRQQAENNRVEVDQEDLAHMYELLCQLSQSWDYPFSHGATGTRVAAIIAAAQEQP